VTYSSHEINKKFFNNYSLRASRDLLGVIDIDERVILKRGLMGTELADVKFTCI
jgi:hypothetical protein